MAEKRVLLPLVFVLLCMSLVDALQAGTADNPRWRNFREKVIITDVSVLESSKPELIRGKVRRTRETLRLSPDALLTIPIEGGESLRNVRVELVFRPPQKEALLPFPVYRNSCNCNLKLQVAGTVIDFADNGIRVYKLDEHYTNPQGILAERELPTGELFGKELTVDVRDRVLRISAGEMPIMTVPGFSGRFDYLALAAVGAEIGLEHFALVEYQHPGLVVGAGYVELSARFYPSHSSAIRNGKWFHMLAWEKGKAHPNSLFLSGVSDSSVSAAMRSLGLMGGENLGREAWINRNEPDGKAWEALEGSPVQIEILFQEKRFSPYEILRPKGQATVAENFRFGGHEKWIRSWETGGIVAPIGSPGSLIGNDKPTLAELVQGTIAFEVAEGLPFGEGDEVVFLFVPQK